MLRNFMLWLMTMRGHYNFISKAEETLTLTSPPCLGKMLNNIDVELSFKKQFYLKVKNKDLYLTSVTIKWNHRTDAKEKYNKKRYRLWEKKFVLPKFCQSGFWISLMIQKAFQHTFVSLTLSLKSNEKTGNTSSYTAQTTCRRISIYWPMIYT